MFFNIPGLDSFSFYNTESSRIGSNIRENNHNRTNLKGPFNEHLNLVRADDRTVR